MSTIRGELRLLRTRVCQAEGIETIDSLLNTQHSDELWNKHFQMLLDASRGFGLGGKSTFQGDFVNILEQTIQASNFRVTHLAEVIAGTGGIEQVLEYLGGQEGFNLWLNSLNLHRQKRSRIRNTIQELISISNQFRESPLQVDVWADFANWLEVR